MRRRKARQSEDTASEDGLSTRTWEGDASTSPSRKSLNFKTSRKFQTVWSTLKRFTPSKIRARRKNNLKDTGRLSASHPDVSHSNLAGLVKPSRDDSYSADMVDALGASSDAPSCSGQARDPLMESALNRQHMARLRQYPFYQLDIHLKQGRDLPAKDSCGTSDPYVKIKSGSKQLFKSKTISKNLNPKWDEYFCVPIEDVFQPIHFRVYDYDFALQDDFMGSAEVDLSQLELEKPTEMCLQLTDTDGSTPELCGTLELTITLAPKSQEEKEQYFGKGRGESSAKKQKIQLWDHVVTIVLIEGKDLLPMDENGLSDPYVKFKLGSEKYKSKVCMKTLTPQWLEQFNLHLYLDQPKLLELSIWDKDFHGKDDFMGQCSIDLGGLKTETTHQMWVNLLDGSGSLFLLLTISGTMRADTVTDLDDYEATGLSRKTLIQRYGLKRSFTDFQDVGHLTVKVFRAVGLAAADLCGKSDPFCVLELTNARLQTHTEYRTLSPEWNKVFNFQVKDIHDVLEVTVYDEDRDKKVEFLGKIAIPLLKVKNKEKRWITLKDKTLRTAVKGQILLELDLHYNSIKSWIRTFEPKEIKYMQPEQKFKRIVFMKNVSRIKILALDFVELAKFCNSCVQWESKLRSITAFIVFLILVYTFEMYMIPVAFLLLFAKNYLILSILGSRDEWETLVDEEDDDDDDKDLKSEEKKSLKEKLQAVQDVTAMVQNILGEIASFGERCKNTFNFSQNFLTWLAICLLLIVTLILYYVPLRFLIMAWGVNKFTKKLRCGDAINNNEILDFLSRVPDNEEKIMYRELKTSISPRVDADKKKKKKSA